MVGDGFRVQPSRGRSQPSGIPQDVARQYSQFSILEKTCLCWKTRLKSMHFSQYYLSINTQLRGRRRGREAGALPQPRGLEHDAVLRLDHVRGLEADAPRPRAAS